jgi:hypothetical protein
MSPRLFLLTGCLLPFLAVLIGGVSLVVHYATREPTSPYQVEFSKPGDACDGDGHREPDAPLILDRRSGDVLMCSVLPHFSTDDSPRSRGAFSAAEVGRVRDLSRSLADDDALTEADQREVRRLVAEIGREHGWTKTSSTLLEDLTWQVGLFGLIGGFAVVMLAGLWAHITEFEPGGPAT